MAIHERPPENTSEGGEFLDDALRMEVPPAGRAEEVGAADVPEDKNEPLSDALRELRKKGYAADLSFETETFALYGDLEMRLNPEGYKVDEIELVEDAATADDAVTAGDAATPKEEEAFVFAISLAGGIKGIIVDRTDHL